MCINSALTRSPQVGIISAVKAISASNTQERSKRDLGGGDRFQNPTMDNLKRQQEQWHKR